MLFPRNLHNLCGSTRNTFLRGKVRTCGKVLLLFIFSETVFVGVAQNGCCPDRVGTLSLEASIFRNTFYAGFGYIWGGGAGAGIRIALGSSFAAAYVQYDGLLTKQCQFDLKVLAILGFQINGIEFYHACLVFGMGIGAEFCLPQVREVGIAIAGGFSFQDCTSCVSDRWGCWFERPSRPFVLLAVKYYL